MSAWAEGVAPKQSAAASSMNRRRRGAAHRLEYGIVASAEAGGLCGIGRGRGNVSAQFRSQFFSDDMRVRTISDDLRANEDDQLGTLGGVALMAERIAEPRDLIEPGNSAAVAALLFADQSSQQHGLAGRHRDRALDPPLRHRRRQAVRAGRWHVADLLLEIGRA